MSAAIRSFRLCSELFSPSVSTDADWPATVSILVDRSAITPPNSGIPELHCAGWIPPQYYDWTNSYYPDGIRKNRLGQLESGKRRSERVGQLVTVTSWMMVQG